MSRRASKGLDAAETTGADDERTAQLSREALWRRAAERIEEASSAQPNSLSGMVAAVAREAPAERPFTTLCELSAGGTAMVYLAVDQRADVAQVVALKHYLPRLMQRRDFAARFVLEMSLARAVDHPYVCRVLDYGRSGTGYYTAMEFMPGEPLSKILAAASMRNAGQRPPRLVAHLLANLAEGLHAIHSLCTADGPVHAVHRDVTPNNLFVLFDGSVRVADFGSAWIHDLLRGKHGAVDDSYLAPEQLERGPIDARVDIWALGAVLWELLAGRRLFRSTTERGTAIELRTHRIAAPSEYNPDVPAELDRIVLKALARKPSERYVSARRLSVDLAEYLARSGGALPENAVVEWLSRLLPNDASRARAMLELASNRTRLPHFPDSDEPAWRARSAYTPTPDHELEHTTRVHSGRLANATLHAPVDVAIPGPFETLSSKHVPISLRHRKHGAPRSWSERLAPLGTACCVVLLGFSAGYATFSGAAANRQPNGARSAAMPVADWLSMTVQPAPLTPTPTPTPSPRPEPKPTIDVTSDPSTLSIAPATTGTRAPSSTSPNVLPTRVKPKVSRTSPSEHGSAKSAPAKSTPAENAASARRTPTKTAVTASEPASKP